MCGQYLAHTYPPFLILKVRHPAVTGVYCMVRDGRSGCSDDFKCVIPNTWIAVTILAKLTVEALPRLLIHSRKIP